MAPAPIETPEKQDTEQGIPKKLPKGVVLGPDGKP
jgi:FAD-linked sulfhydryl oxidase